jgi:O-antigen ligase
LLLAAWGALAFGSVYAWAYGPLAVGSVLIGAGCVTASARGKSAPSAALIAMLVLFVAAGALQLVPLSKEVLQRMSPSAIRAVQNLDPSFSVSPDGSHPLSIAPSSTWTGVILVASAVLLFVGATRRLSEEGATSLVEGLAFLGALVALVGIIQKPVFTGRIYGFWTPIEAGAAFGPFVNKNHFAGWMLMALPVSLGLLFGRMDRAMANVKPDLRNRILWLSSPAASRIVLLAAACALMTLALMLTLSRSGISVFALTVVLAGLFLLRSRKDRRQRTANFAYLMLLVIVIVGWVGVDIVANRFKGADWGDLNDRSGAWGDARDVARRFPLVGTGLNTYSDAMLLYQARNKKNHFSHAHNGYLELAAEGGLLLVIPAFLAAAFLVRDIRRELQREISPSAYFLRAGAVASLGAIALQEIVDFSLQIPGNVVLFAIVCAVAVHRNPSITQVLGSPVATPPKLRLLSSRRPSGPASSSSSPLFPGR